MTVPEPHRPLSEPLTRPLRVAALISGGGTTLVNFLRQREAGQLDIEVPLVVAGVRDCGGIERARKAGLDCQVLPRKEFADTSTFSDAVFEACRRANVDVVALAGFLSLLRIPDDFQDRVLNIHPSLIPAFCGHGFHGARVHRAVLERGAKVSGCTVHFADNEYDHGPIVLQRVVPVLSADTPDTLAHRVFAAECDAYPEALRLFAAARLEIEGSRVRVLDPW
jgi:phosphoribosylglycinamide formyltransferase-1